MLSFDELGIGAESEAAMKEFDKPMSSEPTLPVSQPDLWTAFCNEYPKGVLVAKPTTEKLCKEFATYVTVERDRELQQAREEINKWATAGGKQFKRRESAETSLSEAREELARLRELVLQFKNAHSIMLALTGSTEHCICTLCKDATSALAVPEKPDHHE